MLVFAEDHDAAGNLVGGFKRLLQSEAAVAKLDAQARAAQLAGQNERGGVQLFAERRDIGVGSYLRRGSLFGFCRFD